MPRSTVGRLFAILVVTGGALAGPAGAQAASFFVEHSGSGTECTEPAPCATIALALAASRATPGTGDRIEVGPGLYVERIVVDKPEDASLTLHGAGSGPDQEATPADATTVRAPETNKGPEVAITTASSVSIEALRVEVPAGFVNSGGISLGAAGATARDVDVSNAGDVESEGVQVTPGAPDTKVIDSRVRVSGSNRGVGIFGPRATIVGSDIRTAQGIALDAEQTESPLVLRTRLSTEEATDDVTIRRTSHVLIESSLLLGGRFGIEAYASFGDTSSVRLSNDTIDTGQPKVEDQFGLAAIARAELEGTASVVMVNTVALEKQEVSGTAAQSIRCESSIVPTKTENGPTGTIDCGAANGNIDPVPPAVFVPGPDWHLAAGSPAVDSGAEVDPISETDLDGDPRIADGNGDGTAVIDRGA